MINAIPYPLAIVILAFSVTVFIKNSILLNFAKIKPIAQWPDIGKTLFHLAEFIENW